MKTFLNLIFVFFILSSNFAQVITVVFKNTKAFTTTGDLTSSNHLTLSDSTSVFDVGGSVCKKVFDLKNNQFYFYENNVLKSQSKIKNCQKVKNLYKISIDDINIYTNEPLTTYQYIDVDKNTSFYGWYYEFNNSTWLYKEYNNKVSLSK